MWGQKELSLSWVIEASLHLEHIDTPMYVFYINYIVFMYTDVHVKPEPENIQVTNGLNSMQEYQLQKACCHCNTYIIGNTSKKHPVH